MSGKIGAMPYWQQELVNAYLAARRARQRGESRAYAEQMELARWWHNVLTCVRAHDRKRAAERQERTP